MPEVNFPVVYFLRYPACRTVITTPNQETAFQVAAEVTARGNRALIYEDNKLPVSDAKLVALYEPLDSDFSENLLPYYLTLNLKIHNENH